jgi:hypothetical protein
MTHEPDGAADTRMPAAFLGHGNPMNALDRNRYTEAWSAFGSSVPRPRAITATSVWQCPRPTTSCPCCVSRVWAPLRTNGLRFSWTDMPWVRYR